MTSEHWKGSLLLTLTTTGLPNHFPWNTRPIVPALISGPSARPSMSLQALSTCLDRRRRSGTGGTGEPPSGEMIGTSPGCRPAAGDGGMLIGADAPITAVTSPPDVVAVELAEEWPCMVMVTMYGQDGVGGVLVLLSSSPLLALRVGLRAQHKSHSPTVKRLHPTRVK